MGVRAEFEYPTAEEFEVAGRGPGRRFWARGLSGLHFEGRFFSLQELHLSAGASGDPGLELVHVGPERRTLTVELSLSGAPLPRQRRPASRAAPQAASPRSGTAAAPHPGGLDDWLERLVREPSLFAPLVTLDLDDFLPGDRSCRALGPDRLGLRSPRSAARAPLESLGRRLAHASALPA